VQLPFYAWLAEAAAAYLPINETPVVPLELGGETDIEAICRRLPELLEPLPRAQHCLRAASITCAGTAKRADCAARECGMRLRRIPAQPER